MADLGYFWGSGNCFKNLRGFCSSSFLSVDCCKTFENSKIHLIRQPNFCKIKSRASQPFLSITGVKRVCVLSPLCFNLFINNLSCFYKNNINNNKFCDPAFINKNPINCLMWADNCAIFSLSEKGLQKSTWNSS